MKDHLSTILFVMMLLPSFALASASGSLNIKRNQKQNKYCGWELMQNLNIPIAVLGDLYAKQTGDRSLCTRQDDGSEYCTCIYECGNGVWESGTKGQDGDDRKVRPWVWKEGCNKYCHAGVCDGQR